MKPFYRKKGALILLGGLPMFLFLFPILVWGAEAFVPLADLPSEFYAGTNPASFFNALFKYGIVSAGFLAVIMLTYAGFKYMTTDAVSGKSEAKDIIVSSLSGLFLILFSSILLSIINPNILNFSISMPNIQLSSSQPTQQQFARQIISTPDTQAYDLRLKLDGDEYTLGKITVYGIESGEYGDGERFFIETVGSTSFFDIFGDTNSRIREAAVAKATKECETFNTENESFTVKTNFTNTGALTGTAGITCTSN